MPASMKSLAAAKDASGLVCSVLGFWRHDKRFYSVQVTECDPKTRNCQVVFDDGYKCWLEASDLHCQLDDEKLVEDEIVCCVCEGGNSEPPNDIIICDTCQQGYHLDCHAPTVERAKVNLGDEESEWVCKTCEQIVEHADQKAVAPAIKEPVKTPVSPVPAIKGRKRQSSTIATPKRLLIKLKEPKSIPNVPAEPAKTSNPKEGKVEEMDSLIIATAKALAQEPAAIDTPAFVELMAKDDEKMVECLENIAKPANSTRLRKVKLNSAAAF